MLSAPPRFGLLASRASVAVGLCLLAFGARAGAAPSTARRPAPSVSLSWSGAGTQRGCLGGRALASGVESYLGRRVFSPPPTDIVVRVRVTTNGTRHHALVEVFDTRANEVLGERELRAEGATCSSLNDPLELAVALMVDGDLDARAATPDEPDAAEPKSEAPSEDRLAWEMEAQALAQALLLPKPSAGAELSLSALITEQLRARVELGGFLPAEAEVRAPASAGIGLVYAGLGPCLGASLGPRFSLHGCGGPVVAYATVRHSGLEGGDGGSVSLFGASLGAHATTHLGGPLFATASLRAHYFPAPPRFVYRVDGQEEELFDFEHLGAVAGLGLAVRF